VALVIAMTKMRKGQSRSFNNWLRVRIVAQGFTVAAVVVGSWAYGAAASASSTESAAAQDKATQERAAFESRLRLAEEVTRAESGVVSTTSAQSSASVALPTTAVPTTPTTSTSSLQSWWK
jgi:Hypoxia induced protein conserved region